MRHFFQITFLLLLTSCAQMVAPGGGEKDKTAPRILKYKPDSAATHFNSKKIEILFDEYIVLSDLNNQLIISPPLEKMPETKVKGKSIFIDFNPDETLEPNTTYSFNFGNAIRDLNENNAKEDFKYIFSTGSFIDSLKVSGKVKNAFDHKTEKNILVMLYNDFNDSVVFNQRPNYFTKTKEDGTFKINNIREGKYKIIALKDENNDYQYNGEKEKIAFLESPVDALANKEISLELFQEPIQKLYVKKRVYNSFGKILIVFNKPTDSINIIPLHHSFEKGSIQVNFSDTKDSLTYWFKNNPANDSLILQVNHGSKILDTLEFRLESKEKALKNNRNPLGFYLMKSSNKNYSFDLNSEIKLQFNNPIDSIHKDFKIELMEDSIPYAAADSLAFGFPNLNKQELALGISSPCGDSIHDPDEPNAIITSSCWTTALKLKENTPYHLFIPPGTFTDIFGFKNDSINIDFTTRENKFYGTIKLKVSIPSDSNAMGNEENQYIIQLLDKKENLYRENQLKNDEIIYYDYLYPKEYVLKLIIDKNKNGKWDTGNYLEKQQAEKVIYYDQAVKIRSNWDLDLEWIIRE